MIGSPVASRRKLAILLEKVKGFTNPSERLEQYSIDANSAADLLWTVKSENVELEANVLLDLGCGTGLLTIGGALIGAPLSVGVDVDLNALVEARKAASMLGVDSQTSWVQAHVPDITLRSDIVVENPPFGVKQRGSDLGFLKAAIRSGDIIYSIHFASESSREYLQRFIEQHGGTLSAIIPITMRIRHTLPQHRKRLHGVRAEVYKIKVKKHERSPSSQD